MIEESSFPYINNHRMKNKSPIQTHPKSSDRYEKIMNRRSASKSPIFGSYLPYINRVYRPRILPPLVKKPLSFTFADNEIQGKYEEIQLLFLKKQ